MDWGWEISGRGRNLLIKNKKFNASYELMVTQGEDFSHDVLTKLEPDAPVVVPWYQRGGVICIGLIYHWRPVPATWSWEVIRGFGDSSISDEENARRELLEEWGQNGNLVKIGTQIANTGWDRYTHIIWAAEINPNSRRVPNEEKSEIISKREWFKFPDALPGMVCGISQSALFRFMCYLKKNR